MEWASGGGAKELALASPESESEAMEKLWRAQRQQRRDAEMTELEAEEQRQLMPPPLPKLGWSGL